MVFFEVLISILIIFRMWKSIQMPPIVPTKYLCFHHFLPDSAIMVGRISLFWQVECKRTNRQILVWGCKKFAMCWLFPPPPHFFLAIGNLFGHIRNWPNTQKTLLWKFRFLTFFLWMLDLDLNCLNAGILNCAPNYMLQLELCKMRVFLGFSTPYYFQTLWVFSGPLEPQVKI